MKRSTKSVFFVASASMAWLLAMPASLAPATFVTLATTKIKTLTSAEIRWSSVVPATAEVEYGVTTQYGQRTNPTVLESEHIIALTGLTSLTTYHFRTISKDKLNNVVVSPDQTLVMPGSIDTVAPAAITDLRVLKQDPTSVTLAWTAPGNDGTSGNASRYDIRYSASIPLAMSSLWEMNGQALEAPTPVPSGNTQTFTLMNLLPVTTYYVAVRSTDAADNTSEVSNVLEVRTQPITMGPFRIMDISLANLTNRGVIISWKTDALSSTMLTYGTTEQYELGSLIDGIRSAQHNVIMGGLKPNTTYHVKIRDLNEQGALAQSADFTFKTRE